MGNCCNGTDKRSTGAGPRLRGRPQDSREPVTRAGWNRHTNSRRGFRRFLAGVSPAGSIGALDLRGSLQRLTERLRRFVLLLILFPLDQVLSSILLRPLGQRITQSLKVHDQSPFA